MIGKQAFVSEIAKKLKKLKLNKYEVKVDDIVEAFLQSFEKNINYSFHSNNWNISD